jgi:hypothetical protein
MKERARDPEGRERAESEDEFTRARGKHMAGKACKSMPLDEAARGPFIRGQEGYLQLF